MFVNQLFLTEKIKLMKKLTKQVKTMSITLIMIILALSCHSSQAENEVKLVLKDMSKIVNEFESLKNNNSIQTELKQSKMSALIVKSIDVFEKWVKVYTNAQSELSAEKCQFYSEKWDKLLKRFSEVVKL